MRRTYVIQLTEFVTAPRFAAPAEAVCAAQSPFGSCHETVIVGVGPRTAFQWLSSLAGTIGLALLVPLSVLMIGLPIALAVRGILEAATRLIAFLRL
jgi:hypothetical protein